MPSTTALASLAVGLAALQGVQAGFDNTSSSNVAVYWGQNSYGQSSGNLTQQRLAYYCNNTDIDIIPLAFMTAISDSTGHPQLNFANQGDKCSTFNGTQLLNCPELATDIPLCQQTYNKTILLSIGGATYTEGGFATADAAVTAADMIWAAFGPPPTNTTNTTTTTLRPFGAAQVDGFDFDFESTVSNISPFAARLRTLMDTVEAGDGRHRLLTAAPQCPYPDAADDAFLSGTGAVPMDAVFVQFYNNYCGVQSFVPGAAEQNNFNYATWDEWARTEAANAGEVKVFVGVPGGQGAAGSGYLAAGELEPVLEFVGGGYGASFGGVMVWDASQAVANGGFLGEVKGELVALEGGEAEAEAEVEVEVCGGGYGGRTAWRGVEFRA
ncbi:glycoside hydrolase family 18 protein [Diplodia corticola]|uniref:chitinase n=1 Tax=Diplodia corticola TaxID=236234 RepID=A0A1J9RNL7_9PEZI|nr:glycoside hydrolase family 18 protein [Diplodia corticola]OJD30071.1 glycoside hydrolase family 18 protein [Diplodia corticola]